MKIRLVSAVMVAVTAGPFSAFGQTRAVQIPANNPLAMYPRDRITAPIESGVTVALSGDVHPEARPENEVGRAPGNLSMSRVILTLQRSAEQQAALDAYSEALQNPRSPFFHQWLTPETFGLHFGLSQNDLNRVAGWLSAQGFTIDEIPSGHWSITFSGTAALAESAFRTEIHYYRVAGEVRYANSTDPQIPQALAGIIAGVAGLNNIRPQHVRANVTGPSGGGAGGHYLDPSDFATIYNLNPLYSKGLKGNGVQIAVIEDCSMDVSLAATFWNLEGVAQTSNAYWDYGTAPACGSKIVDEVFLDYEWSGAIAPAASIWLVTSSSSDPLLGAVQGVVEHGVNNSFAPLVTMSYEDCESTYDLNNWVPLWQQAQTQGITGLVSSGDIGAAACDYPGTTVTATHGRTVNGFCASPYVVCVGGTQFNDVANPSQYWSPTGHALGYIAEIAWNESGTLGSTPTIWGASGGGYSTIQPRPSWQSGNTQRGEPDVAFSSASHDGYRICDPSHPCDANYLWEVAGTSAAAPSFAGIMALIIQAAGKQGSPNPTLYSLAGQPSLGVFHDIVSGNNSVNGVTGFSAGPGWDAATGLGSVNATALLSNWPGASAIVPVLTNLEMTKSPPPASGCAVPPAASAFLTTDNVAYLFFGATVTTADNLTSDWLAPNGDVLTGGSWAANSAGSYCFVGTSLNISNPSPAHLGGWQARIYDNGSQIGSVAFTLTAPAAITSLSPSTVIAGSGAFTLTVNGTGFVSGATVLWGGTPLPTSFVSGTQLTATVAGNLIAAAGSALITVSSAGLVSSPATITFVTLPPNLSRIGVLPQLAAGAGWDTAVYLTNASGSAVPVALAFHADDGTALILPVSATQQGKTQDLSTSELIAAIPPNTTLAVDTQTLSANVEGWVDVLSSGALTGFAVFRYAPQGLSGGPGLITPWEGTVPLQTLLAPALLTFPFDNTNGFSSGLALGNLKSTGANFTATFFDGNGNPLGSPQTIALSGNGHTSFLLNAQYGFTANASGIVKITGGSMMAIGLRASPYGTLTSIPVPLQ
jgi:pseudomonalisin